MNALRPRMGAISRLSAALIATAVAPLALAVPITYQFSTGTTTQSAVFPGGNGAEAQALATALSGFSVAGTFVYDNEAPLVATTTASPFTNHYAPAVVDLIGSVAGYEFADGSGVAMVGDEGYVGGAPPGVPPPPPADFLQLAFNGPPPAPADFTGFVLNGFTLTNVRMFWIENQRTPTLVPDFLSSNALLPALPAFNGRLALDFSNGGPLTDPTTLRFVFFDGLTVTPVSVPEPVTLSLLSVGLLGLAAARRRRPRA